MLIFKDEANFLKEWFEYHIMLGVDHFYLYQNNSNDDYREVIKPYIDKGLITFIEWPDNPGQHSANIHWYNNYRRESKWITFIDVDEFICPIKHDNIADMLRTYEKFPVVIMYWRLFGTSGYMKHDYSKLVIEQYTVSRPKLFTQGKIFYNTRFDIEENSVSLQHGFNTVWKGIKLPPINSYKRLIIWNIHRASHKNNALVQVNHYWSKSYDCWLDKYEKGSVEKGNRWKNYSFFRKLELKCIASDFTIFRFIIDLKLILKKNINE